MKRNSLLIIFFGSLLLTGAGCLSDAPAQKTNIRQHTDTWSFPVRPGFTKQEAVSIAGTPSPQSPNPDVAWYPESGVSFTYDEYGRVDALNFKGNLGHEDWITYKKEIVDGIKLSMGLNELIGILGNPDVVAPPEYSEQIYSWKREGYVIHATIWADDHTENSVTYPKGTISWLEIERSL